MRRPSFTTVVATDGSAQGTCGYRYLLAHAIATLLLFIAMVLAVWLFVASVVDSSACSKRSSHSTASSSTAPGAARATAVAYRGGPGCPHHTDQEDHAGR
jgi:hypothetical protein